MSKILSILLLLTTFIFANIGSVTLLEGEAVLTRNNDTKQLSFGDVIEKSDFIETRVNSKIKITFIDNTVVTIGKESTLNVDDYFFSADDPRAAKSEFSITKGAFHAVTGQIAKSNPSQFKLKTRNATIGIRGTEIYGDQTRVFCTQGAIYIESQGIVREVQSGYFVNTIENQPPTNSMPIDKEQFDDVDSKLNTNSISTLDNQSGNESSSDTSAPIVATDTTTTATSSTSISSDDAIDSWGYWATSTQEVANEFAPTDPSYIQGLINSSTQIELEYEGSISVPGVSPIRNSISFEFQFGLGTASLSGNFEYQDSANSFRGEFAGAPVTASGFSANDRHEIMGPPNNKYSINGYFLGADASSVAGDITMRDMASGDTVSGTFAAPRD